MKRDTYINSQQGYIAIISAIVISIVLIGITFTLSFSGFFLRFNVLGTEYKKVSYALAEGCMNVAFVKLANNNSYTGNEEIVLDTANNRKCRIISVIGSGGTRTVRTQAVYQNAYTDLEAIASITSSNITANSWKECATFTSC